jgi:hypothetical protein
MFILFTIANETSSITFSEATEVGESTTMSVLALLSADWIALSQRLPGFISSCSRQIFEPFSRKSFASFSTNAESARE